MPWSSPRTYIAGEVHAASTLNTDHRDNINALRAGGVAITSQAAGDVITASSTEQFSRVAPSTAAHVLSSNGAGVAPSFQALSASNLSTGTVPDARFPATLPTLIGANLTALNASNLSSGTVASARLPAVVTSTPILLTDGASVALDASLGRVFSLQAAGNRTLQAPSNPTNGQTIIIAHKASGAARTLTLTGGTGGFRFGTDITALTETASGKIDYIGCVYHLTLIDAWEVVAYSKGY